MTAIEAYYRDCFSNSKSHYMNRLQQQKLYILFIKKADVIRILQNFAVDSNYKSSYHNSKKRNNQS